ncbi:hypothetical protein G5B30_14920 [Sphingobacterium sp. SGG-5]|uniref:DUF5689 domain-containing protein n=1 Tax=Sphingobacterium sp. SGG-5 TaxID=2710881 RepID=UPI0013EE1F17|nr:DUF5689 domain-containing protein [Sphingobacterium sp. SGG-5]NGM63200.1 hypothetical protein [Sphingobacterium sp. SGG-5]
MKRIIYMASSLLIAAVALVSCFKDPSLTEALPTKRLSVASLRELYEGQTITLNEQNVGITPLSGTIISDISSGNVEPGKFVMVQNFADERNDVIVTAGITVSLESAEPVTFAKGDSVVFDIRGATLTRENGSLEVQGIRSAAIYKIRSNCVVEPISLTLAELSADFDKYESMLVQITAADVLPIDGGTKYEGTKRLNDGSGVNNVNIYTSPDATFASEEMPTNANFRGIATSVNDTKQIRIRNTDDVTITSIPHESAILITGFMSDPAGTDISVTDGYLGGFEYVQLMATKDIDFSTHPYSVVFARNAPSSTAPGEGWATGGTRSFKFNLTSGTAVKGTFFYVGGPEKRIAGSISGTEKTTDISETAPIEANRANWIRAIPMGTGSNSATAPYGDDFGGSTNDWLYNRSSYFQSIAVFDGTTVTATTAPIDAIFYGDSGYASFRLFDATTSTGYLIPNNDWYNTTGLEGPQPYYKQGDNTFIYGGVQPTADSGNWASLGGVYSLSARVWIAPRTISYSTLLPTGTPPNQPQLSDIETGTTVTKVRE